MMRRAVISCLTLVLAVGQADAQRPQSRRQADLQPVETRTGLTADTVRVGDVVGVAVQIDLPPGAELAVPDTLELTGDLENAARKRVRVDSLSNGLFRHLVTYPITIWRPGQFPLPGITLTVRSERGDQAIAVALPEVSVISVLPPDTTGVEARPPRDVWGASRLWWPLLLAALLALAVFAAIIWWWRRRQRNVVHVAEPVRPQLPPREWALRELVRIASAGWLERGEYRAFYIALSDTLRRYASMLDEGWSTDLTTRELMQRFEQSKVDPGAVAGILERADLVKFARHQPGRERPRADLEAARQWIETFDKPLVLAEAA